MSVLRRDKQDGVLTLTLNRPASKNAFNTVLEEKLTEALTDAEDDSEVRCLLLQGADGVFSAGGDITRMEERFGDVSPTDRRHELLRGIHGMIETLFHLELPTVAKVEGAAIGAGANVALACDIVVTTEDATFGETFRNVGVTVDSGGSFLLPQLVGLHRAKELVFTGDTFDGNEAAEMGLVNRAVPAEDIADEVAALTECIADGPTETLVLAKELLNRGATASMDEALRNEANLGALAYTTQDHRNAVDAFLDDEEPDFSGR